MKNYKNTEEQIARIKQLISEETLYGKLVDNNLITEGSGLRSIVDDIIDLYQIPPAKLGDVENALSKSFPDGIESKLKSLGSFTKINKVIGDDFSIADFKEYLGSNAFTNDIEAFFKEVNTELDSSITTGMKFKNPHYLNSHQKAWNTSVGEVTKEINGLQKKLKSGAVSVDDVEKTFLKNFDEFIKNYKKVGAKYKNLNVFKDAITYVFGSHKGDLKGLFTKIQTHYKEKVLNFKDWGNWDAYKSRFKEGWGKIRAAKGKWGKVKEYVRLSKDILPVGYYTKYIHAFIIKTLIMEIYCNAREEYDPFQMDEGVTHNKKIIKEDEEGYTALDPSKELVFLILDNFFKILKFIAAVYGLPLTSVMLDPLTILGHGLTDFSCENFYVKNIKDIKAEIIDLMDSGQSLEVKTKSGEIISISGTQLKAELNKVEKALKNSSQDPFGLLKAFFGFGKDVTTFTLVDPVTGDDIPLLDGTKINEEWLDKIKELREEYDEGE